MLQRSSSIEDLGKNINNYVDCYVSTDLSEIEEVLAQIGFQDTTYYEKKRQTLLDIYDGFEVHGSSLKDPKTSLEIDCVDIPLEEALGKRGEIGFMPMSKFRVYTNGSPNAAKILLPIMKALEKERQNMAFINDAGSTSHVRLSEFYC